MSRVEIGYFQDTLRQPANKCNVFVKTVLVLKLQNDQDPHTVKNDMNTK